jgi:hypothetical protein
VAFLPTLFALIVVASLVFTIEMSCSQNMSTTNDLNPNIPSNTNITVPVNPDRLEIVIPNDNSGNSDNEQGSDWFIPIVTAGAAIGGGVIGSLLTYRHNRKIEEQKNEYARRLEEQRINTEHRKEEEFNARIRELVLIELKNHSDLLYGLLYTAETAMEKYKSGWEVVVKTPSRYTSMSLEKRISIFNPRALTEVEGAYYWLVIFKEGFLIELDRYLNKQITIEQLRDILAVEQKKSVVDKAIKAIEEEHP